jgi:hypothetical protein
LITLALLGATALAPDQNGLKLDDGRFTYGPLGQSRKKDEKFLPGDVVVLSLTAKGLQVDKDGVVQYRLDFEVTKKGQKKPVTQKEGANEEQLNWLGGGDVPFVAFWPIPLSGDSPGDYEMKVTVTDLAAKKSASLTRAFTVDKLQFGFVGTFLMDEPVAVLGQKRGVAYSLVGFDLDKKTERTDVTVSIRVLDENDKPTAPKALTSTIKRDPEQQPVKGVLTFNPAIINLNRAGKFKVELTATDNVSKATAKVVLDLTVVELK